MKAPDARMLDYMQKTALKHAYDFCKYHPEINDVELMGAMTAAIKEAYEVMYTAGFNDSSFNWSQDKGGVIKAARADQHAKTWALAVEAMRCKCMHLSTIWVMPPETTAAELTFADMLFGKTQANILELVAPECPPMEEK